MVNGNNPEGVTTPAPISDADSRARKEPGCETFGHQPGCYYGQEGRECVCGLVRARLVEERKNGLPCTLVADDGMYCGTSFEVRCTGPWRCIEAGGCFWRRWHQLSADKMRKCDAGLDD